MMDEDVRRGLLYTVKTMKRILLNATGMTESLSERVEVDHICDDLYTVLEMLNIAKAFLTEDGKEKD